MLCFFYSLDTPALPGWVNVSQLERVYGGGLLLNHNLLLLRRWLRITTYHLSEVGCGFSPMDCVHAGLVYCFGGSVLISGLSSVAGEPDHDVISTSGMEPQHH